MSPAVFRPRFGRALTLGVAAACVLGLVTTAVQDVGTAVRYAPAFLLAVVVVWALFGRPAVIVDDGGVTLRNVLRSVELPWPAIERIDTKYALTLYTAYGVYAAWAAPAPSRMQVLGAAPEDTRHLPDSTYIGGGVRPGDLSGTPSGDAAAHIRRQWDRLHAAGHLDERRLERDRPVVRWHVLPALGVAALAALTLFALRQ